MSTRPFTDYDFEQPLPHPGSILREDYMAPLGLTAGALARAMRLKDRARIERVVRELQPVTPDTALRVETVFGASAQYWLNLQGQHDLSRVLIAQKAEMLAVQPLDDGRAR